MVKHLILWKLKDSAEGRSKAENATMIKEMLERLNGVIPQVVGLEVGVNFNNSDAAYDLALCSVFKNEADLAIYQSHPEHIKVSEFTKKVVDSRIIVDYTV